MEKQLELVRNIYRFNIFMFTSIFDPHDVGLSFLSLVNNRLMSIFLSGPFDIRVWIKHWAVSQ